MDVGFAALSNVFEVYLELLDENNVHMNYESFPVEDDDFKNNNLHLSYFSSTELKFQTSFRPLYLKK